MSQTTRFQLAGIYNFSKQKAKVERLKETMAGVADVKLGEEKWVTLVHDPSTTAAQIRKVLEDMNLHPIAGRMIKN